ncbi:putative deoxyhypusine synthase [Tilletiaria anomala UBC 951]|uniref:deoxyhypusine synthase n=1 Tax=Tilletiaria anomala (strain ATCC 24038 / CBS 436.72 / UBC 951) TaxID=1037660 RepID=A0A066V3A5_TILAU|nr:putative deoxyhypusine synthase [Tilletiaria anomala UBC 951]KDN36197.1 putative deoxyhypusine synthase [Tilletiaria anomala UBC 951]
MASTASSSLEVQSSAQAAVFVPSQPINPAESVQVRGPDFNAPQTLDSLLASFSSVGFQATELGKAIELVREMQSWRLAHEPVQPETEPDEHLDPVTRSNYKCRIFLGYTSNLISSGLRDVIRYLVQHKHVSAIVTTAGGVEEDIIKCLGPTYLGNFAAPGADLRKRGLNRIGNLIVPNDNYCKFEDWLMPILDKMRDEQGDHVDNVWTPSAICRRLGQEIDDESSVLYWAAKNAIPVFCPALTDGSLGDMLYFHSYKNPGLVVDLVKDIRKLNDLSVKARKAGIIILGGGVCKHQIANAMLFRNGADYAVFINTGQEFDGSDSGARPDEAVSWGKIKSAERGGKCIKVSCDASIAFPLLVAATFANAQSNAK